MVAFVFFGAAASVMIVLVEFQLTEIGQPSASAGELALYTDILRLELRQVITVLAVIPCVGGILAAGLSMWLSTGLLAHHSRRIAALEEALQLLEEAEMAGEDGDLSRAEELLRQVEAIHSPASVGSELSALVAQRAAAERVGRDLQELTADALASVRRLVQGESQESSWVRWSTIFQGLALGVGVLALAVAYLTWRS